jgi:hypothetical protein
MPLAVEAVYESGVLKPMTPLAAKRTGHLLATQFVV